MRLEHYNNNNKIMDNLDTVIRIPSITNINVYAVKYFSGLFFNKTTRIKIGSSLLSPHKTLVTQKTQQKIKFDEIRNFILGVYILRRERWE